MISLNIEHEPTDGLDINGVLLPTQYGKTFNCIKYINNNRDAFGDCIHVWVNKRETQNAKQTSERLESDVIDAMIYFVNSSALKKEQTDKTRSFKRLKDPATGELHKIIKDRLFLDIYFPPERNRHTIIFSMCAHTTRFDDILALMETIRMEDRLPRKVNFWLDEVDEYDKTLVPLIRPYSKFIHSVMYITATPRELEGIKPHDKFFVYNTSLDDNYRGVVSIPKQYVPHIEDENNIGYIVRVIDQHPEILDFKPTIFCPTDWTNANQQELANTLNDRYGLDVLVFNQNSYLLTGSRNIPMSRKGTTADIVKQAQEILRGNAGHKGFVITGNYKLNRANTYITEDFGFTHAIVGNITFGCFSSSSPFVNMYQTLGRLATRISNAPFTQMYITPESYQMAVDGENHIRDILKYTQNKGDDSEFVMVGRDFVVNNGISAKSPSPKTKRPKVQIDVEFKEFDTLEEADTFKKVNFGGNTLNNKRYRDRKRENGFIFNTIRSVTKVMTVSEIIKDIKSGVGYLKSPTRLHVGYREINPLDPKPVFIVAYNPRLKK